MALDFPSNPVNNQVYGNYYYDSTVGVWRGFGTGIPNPLVDAIASSSVASTIPLVARGSASQSANLQEWQNSSGTTLSSINSAGALSLATPLTIANGGTGATTLSTAQTNLQIPLSQNYIINGGFDIWQRGTSFSYSGASGTYSADRWAFFTDGTGSAVTVSQQTFTPGAAPVSGYEGKYFIRVNRTVAGTGNTYSNLQQPIEDVRTLAGQAATISFWAKADSARSLGCYMTQDFGTGGSAAVSTTVGTASVTTSWQRFSFTVTLPSVLGKTISATDSKLYLFLQCGNAVSTFDIWGMQLEAGSVATPFRRNANSLQGELAACQRYFYRYLTILGVGHYYSTTGFYVQIPLPVDMRVAPPTGGITANSATLWTVYAAGAGSAVSAVAYSTSSPRFLELQLTTGARTAGYGGHVALNAGSLDVSAEL